MTSAKLWRFDALDSWFFRESRPHGTAGGNELNSLFPPPAYTVAGAVRALIGRTQGVDWDKFSESDSYPELKQQIGDSEHFGQLQLTGPFLLKNGERLYPAPLHVLAQFDAGGSPEKYAPLRPGAEPVECDLGKVRLPEFSKPLPGAKPLENVWLTGAQLERTLSGKDPAECFHKKALFATEPRLGIARDNARRTTIEGLMYQTRHIRLLDDVALGVVVSGIDAELQPAAGLLRFGGEGRPGAVTVRDTLPAVLTAPTLTAGKRGLLLMLLTHADFGGDWHPPGFTHEDRDDARVWRGAIHGVELTIHSAALGKPVREGGWDLAKQQPRPVVGLVPAGSVYFCEVAGDHADAVRRLQGCRIGNNTALGRGEIALGLWDLNDLSKPR